MVQGARYVHTNLIAHDWRRLAAFYQNLFGCVPVPPERDYSGPALEAGTGVAGAALSGVHLRLPGCGESDDPARADGDERTFRALYATTYLFGAPRDDRSLPSI